MGHGLRIALVAYLLALAAVLLAPTSAFPSYVVTSVADRAAAWGLSPTLFAPARVEFLLNVLILVPLTTVARVLWPRRGWTEWTAYGFVVACVVEAVQVPMAGRSASMSDVVANTLGALVGALLGAALVRLRSHQEYVGGASDVSGSSGVSG